MKPEREGKLVCNLGLLNGGEDLGFGITIEYFHELGKTCFLLKEGSCLLYSGGDTVCPRDVLFGNDCMSCMTLSGRQRRSSETTCDEVVGEE